MATINMDHKQFEKSLKEEKLVLVDFWAALIKRSIIAFESGATIESTALPFRYNTSVGITSISSASAS